MSTLTRHLDGGSREKPLPVKPPRACLVKPVAARRDFLGLTWDSPIRGLRLQPAATGRLGGAPSGTRLGTTTPVEHSNSKRIRSLEGRRLRIISPVILGKRPRTESRVYDGRPKTRSLRHASSGDAILPIRNFSTAVATTETAGRSARKRSLAGARRCPN